MASRRRVRSGSRRRICRRYRQEGHGEVRGGGLDEHHGRHLSSSPVRRRSQRGAHCLAQLWPLRTPARHRRKCLDQWTLAAGRGAGHVCLRVVHGQWRRGLRRDERGQGNRRFGRQRPRFHSLEHGRGRHAIRRRVESQHLLGREQRSRHQGFCPWLHSRASVERKYRRWRSALQQWWRQQSLRQARVAVRSWRCRRWQARHSGFGVCRRHPRSLQAECG